MSVIEELRVIETAKAAVLQLLLFEVQNALGHLLLRRSPPKRNTFGGDLLNLGCGESRFQGWVNADMYRIHNLIWHRHFFPDWMLDARKPWACPDNYWGGIYTEHMLEHLSYANGIAALKECYRTLKSGAWIRIVVPDLGKVMRAYMSHERTWPVAVAGKVQDISFKAVIVANLAQNYGHISVWDSELLTAVLKAIGFQDVQTVSFGEGGDINIIRDSEVRRAESLYIVARKAS